MSYLVRVTRATDPRRALAEALGVVVVLEQRPHPIDSGEWFALVARDPELTRHGVWSGSTGAFVVGEENPPFTSTCVTTPCARVHPGDSTRCSSVRHARPIHA